MGSFVLLCVILALLQAPAYSYGLQAECFPKKFNDPIPVDRTLRFGQNTPHDSGKPSNFPCWFDVDLARVGQKFAQKYFGHLFFATSLALVPLSADEQSKRIVLTARRSHNPKDQVKTNIATAQQVLIWFHTDVLNSDWTESLENVRKIHQGVSSYVTSTPEYFLNDLDKKKEKNAAWYNFERNERMWAAFKMDLKDLDETPGYGPQPLPVNDPSARKFKMNQYVMTLALWAFMALPILKPENIGILNYNVRDLQGFAHLWATIGHKLGIEDEYLFCKDTLNKFPECKQSLEDILTHILLPQLRNLDAEGETLIEGTLNGLGDTLPGIPPDVWLINFLEKHLGVRARNLRRQQKLTSILFGSTSAWFVNDISSQVGPLRKTFNAITNTFFKAHSLRLFGDDGSNSTLVARNHFTWALDEP